MISHLVNFFILGFFEISSLRNNTEDYDINDLKDEIRRVVANLTRGNCEAVNANCLSHCANKVGEDI